MTGMTDNRGGWKEFDVTVVSRHLTTYRVKARSQAEAFSMYLDDTLDERGMTVDFRDGQPECSWNDVVEART